MKKLQRNSIIIIIIILSCLTSLDSRKPFRKRISVHHDGLSTPIYYCICIVVIIEAGKKMQEREMKYTFN